MVVLHDIEGGCLPRLTELLRRLEDIGVAFEQDFPDAVTLTREEWYELFISSVRIWS